MERIVIPRLGLLVVGGLALTSPAQAQGDAEAGQMLTQLWCTGCHVVDEAGYGADVGPALPRLLGDDLRTGDEIRGWLADPHPPMPDLDLTRQEIEDIVAYLESLAGE
jgi:cytochrome c